ncbi:MAG: hypothetical protein HQK75_07615, partial [Candidatus Magnetomorum sp.]|nr:hypothetical protein [Candidatus Magnetomorum sp.]
YGYALSVTGDSFMDGNLNVSGTISSDIINVDHIAYSATPLDVSRDVIISGDLSLTGSLSAGLIEVTDFRLIPSGLFGYVMDISGDTLISGNMDVTGTLFAGAIDVSRITMAAASLDVSRDVNIYGSLDLQQAVRMTPLAGEPSSPVEGMLYYDVTNHKLRVYDGSAWQNCF